MRHQVAITGIGVLSAIGMGSDAFTHGLRQGRCGIAMLEGDLANVAVPMGAVLRDFHFVKALQALPLERDFINKARRAAGRSPFTVQATTVATLEAALQADLLDHSLDPRRLGLVVAGSNLSNHYAFDLTEKFKDHPEYLSPSYALHYLDTDHVGTLSELVGIGGEGFSCGGASASGGVGLIQAARLVALGERDLVVVVAAPADLGPMEFQGFAAVGAMGGKTFAQQPEAACRPFDTKSEGFIYGQGSACFVLESKEHAKQRGAKVLAEIAGWGQALDRNRFTNPSQQGEAYAMAEAVTSAGLAPDEVDYLNAHGTSSPLGDKTELEAVHDVFGAKPELTINATKGLTGHCLYAAGMVEAVAVVQQMREGFLHPNHNLEKAIDPDLNFCGPESTTAEIRTALSNSFGFGGINTSVCFKKVD